ncbi:MAG: ABC transporter permease, partial [Clostridium sp.]
MKSVLKLELKKILNKKGTLIMWAITLFLAYGVIGEVSVSETYADIFNKFYLFAPLMGIIMFMIFSDSYITEYDCNMNNLIKTTINGKKEVV